MLIIEIVKRSKEGVEMSDKPMSVSFGGGGGAECKVNYQNGIFTGVGSLKVPQDVVIENDLETVRLAQDKIINSDMSKEAKLKACQQLNDVIMTIIDDMIK